MRIKRWMKGLTAAMTAALLSLTCALTSFSITIGAVADLQELDIVDSGTVEDLRLNDCITRAEFAKIVVRLMGWESSMTQVAQRFVDVPQSHWAADYINICASMGVFEGTGEGKFEPNRQVVMQDVLKTLVTALGYRVKAEASGGYPQGYLAQANALRITAGINGGYGDNAVRADVFQAAANALDIETLEDTAYGEHAGLTLTKGDTLRNLLMERQNLHTGTGIVTANYDAYLSEKNPSLEADEIEIDRRVYRVGDTNAADFLGARVVYTAQENQQTGEYVLVSIHLYKSVEQLTVTDDELESMQGTEIQYTQDDSGYIETAEISDGAIVLYNNRPVSALEDAALTNGTIRMYDNDGDGRYEVVLVSDYISFLVDSTNVGNRLVKIKGSVGYTDPLTNQTSSSIRLDEDEQNCRIVIRTAEGAPAAFDDIAPGMLVSLFVSRDGQYRKAVLSDKRIEGVIEELGDDDTCVIDNVTYQWEQKELAAMSADDIRAGASVTASVNFAGKLGYIEVAEDSGVKYGYVARQRTNGLDASTVQIVLAGTVETVEEDKDNDPETTDDITKYLVARNDSVQTKTLSQSLKMDGKRVGVIELPTMTPLKFKFNSKDEIVEVSHPNAIPEENKTYNASEKVFGKTMGQPFGIDDRTVVLCIPKQAVGSSDDYLAEVRMENGQSYLVSGYEYDANQKCNVDLFTITDEMVFDDKPNIGYRTKIAVVQKMAQTTDDENNSVTKITLLTEGAVKTMTVADYADIAADALQTGDVIYYAQNGRHELTDYRRVARLSSGGIYLTGADTDDECALGTFSNIAYDRIEASKNWRVHEITIDIDNPRVYRLRVGNSMPVFLYDARRNTVSFGTAEDFRAGSDKVFIHAKSGVAQGFIIVRGQ